MKKSEQLIEESRIEENDIKSYSLYLKALRENRYEKFIEDFLNPLSLKYKVIETNNGYSIETEKFGVLDFFPKKNKILIRKENKWNTNGLQWINKHLLKS